MNEINNSEGFELQFNNTFGDVDRTTLSGIVNSRIRVELGGEQDNDDKSISQAIERSAQILQYCFSDKDVWVRVILWGDKEEGNLKKAGLDTTFAIKVFKQKSEDTDILYLYFNRYLKEQILSLIRSIVNFDLAKQPAANITCYFINFSSKLVVNVYDDRGADIYSIEPKLYQKIKAEFADWII